MKLMADLVQRGSYADEVMAMLAQEDGRKAAGEVTAP